MVTVRNATTDDKDKWENKREKKNVKDKDEMLKKVN